MQNEPKRLLLPFTHGVSVTAIDNAVRLAYECHATLVALALVPSSDPRRGARLEHIQQAKDFLEAVRRSAQIHHVPCERYEIFTRDSQKSIEVFSTKLHCTGLIIFTGGRALMSEAEVRAIMQCLECPLYMIQFPTRSKAGLASLFRSILPVHRKQQAAAKRPVGASVFARMSIMNDPVRFIKIENLN